MYMNKHKGSKVTLDIFKTLVKLKIVDNVDIDEWTKWYITVKMFVRKYGARS